MWITAVLFFFYDALLRIYPSVMIHDLMSTFSITAEDAGFLDSLYFYVYAAMQLPVGLLLDRYGASKILSCAALLSGVASILYGIAPNVLILGTGRVLQGLGTSFGFVGMLYATARLFSSKHFALLIGFGTAIGMLGAFVAQGPTALLAHHLSWRSIAELFGAAGIIIALLIFVAYHFRHHTLPFNRSYASLKETLEGLLVVIRHPQSWVNASVAFFFYATTTGFAVLWGTTFLSKTHALSLADAGFAVSMVTTGWLIGSPLFGFLSDLAKRRRPFLLGGALCGAIVLAPVLYISQLPLGLIFTLLFFVGLFSSAQMQNYTLTVMLHGKSHAGASSAFINFVSMWGGSLFQFLVGYLLDLSWKGKMERGIQVFSDANWKMAMSIFPLTFLIAFVLCFFLKEYYHEA